MRSTRASISRKTEPRHGGTVDQARKHVRARKLEIAGLFAGIGGLELGLSESGHFASTLCEIDPEAATVLKHRFTDAVLVRDVRDTSDVLASISPTAQLLTAGFPCTDLSQAGTTRGFAGGRSSLIRHAVRILKAKSFPHVLIENVPNWRVLHGGVYFAEVIRALERLGYAWAYRTIDARAFGLPQRRHRLFLYATLDGDPRPILFDGDATPDESVWSLRERAHGFYWTEGSRGLGWGEDCVPTLKGGSSIGVPAPPAIVMPELSFVTPNIRDAERLQGLPAGWTDFRSSIDGGPYASRRRWLLVGNAVNVRVSAWIGKNLAQPPSVERDSGRRLRTGDPWPAAAWGDRSARWAVEVGAWPVRVKQRPLADFLQYPVAQLSERAAAGFLARYKAGGLKIKRDFLEALEGHLRQTRMSNRAAA